MLGTWAFVALALLLAGTLRAEAVLAVANLVWVVLLAVGGVIVPRSELPAGVSHVVGLLPSAGLGDGLRSALVAGELNLPAARRRPRVGGGRDGARGAAVPLRRLTG